MHFKYDSILEIEYTLDEVDLIAKQIIENITSKVILFNGEMGVGKTTLIKSLVKNIGSNDTVSSPTFSLVNEYKTDTDSIFHFDLYRIEEEEELYNFGIEDYLITNHWIFVEWPEILLPLIENNYNMVTLKAKNNLKRIITLS